MHISIRRIQPLGDKTDAEILINVLALRVTASALLRVIHTFSPNHEMRPLNS